MIDAYSAAEAGEAHAMARTPLINAFRSATSCVFRSGGLSSARALGFTPSVRLDEAKGRNEDAFLTMRDNIILQCPECKNRNYHTTKNKKKTTERLELSKYCPFCRKHTAHKETK